MFNTIRYEIDAGVATITLARPDKLNAFTVEMMHEFIRALDQVDADDAVRAVIVTGEGRAFCAGADLSEGASGFSMGQTRLPTREDGTTDYSSESLRDGGGLLSLRIYRCLKPIIAAINGPAVGIGATMTLPMDVRLAAETARLGFVFARRGIVPEASSSYFLPRIVGISQALEWCYTGRVFPATEALAAKLVKSLHKPEDLLPAAQTLACEIADNTAPVSVALIRHMLWRGLGMTHPMEAHKIESRGIATRARSRDAAEGVAAFFEKRQAMFTDRVSEDLPDFFPWWEEPKYE